MKDYSSRLINQDGPGQWNSVAFIKTKLNPVRIAPTRRIENKRAVNLRYLLSSPWKFPFLGDGPFLRRVCRPGKRWMGNYVCNITCYGLLAPYSALNDNFVRPRIALRPKKYGRPFGNKPTLSIFRPYRCNAASPMALSDSRLWIVIRDITRYLRKIIFFLIYKL